ncbi:MAG: DoxX family protein [Rubrivivax sp.]
MNTDVSRPHMATPRKSAGLAAAVRAVNALFARIPHSPVALLARLSIAAVFWASGQTKVKNFSLNFVTGEFELGWPRLSDSVVDLFIDEYKVPLLSPQIAAPLTTIAEHVLPLLLLFGLATRLSAFALLCMTAVIQVFVYPAAYATHGTWAAVLLYLMMTGPGRISIDHWLATRARQRA